MAERNVPSIHATEPATESYAALVAWLHGPPKRSQALLAAACDISQPTLSQYATRRGRPSCDSEAARLLELATGGRVTAEGWSTSEELQARHRRRVRASSFARVLAKSEQLRGDIAAMCSRERATIASSGSRSEADPVLPTTVDAGDNVGSSATPADGMAERFGRDMTRSREAR